MTRPTARCANLPTTSKYPTCVCVVVNQDSILRPVVRLSFVRLGSHPTSSCPVSGHPTSGYEVVLCLVVLCLVVRLSCVWLSGHPTSGCEVVLSPVILSPVIQSPVIQSPVTLRLSVPRYILYDIICSSSLSGSSLGAVQRHGYPLLICFIVSFFSFVHRHVFHLFIIITDLVVHHLVVVLC